MAGQIPLVSRYYPGDFQVTSVTVHAPNHGKYPVLFPDRNIVVDSVGVYVEDSVNQNLTTKVVAVPGTTVPNYASPPTGQVDVTTGLALTTGGSYPVLAETGTTSGFTVSTQNNLVPSGSALWLLNSGDFAGVAGSINVRIRWRSTF